jgi:hypothetical protein
MALQRVDDEDKGRAYLLILHRMWLEKLDELCSDTG